MADSLDAVARIRESYPGIKVVGLGVPEVEDVVVPFVRAGMAGYLPRSGTIDDLVRLARSVVKGETIASPRITASVFRWLSDASSGVAPLTPRELEIAQLLERGCSNEQIAKKLGIEVTTVKKHVHNILGKLQISRRGQVGHTLRRHRPRRLRQLYDPAPSRGDHGRASHRNAG